MADIKGRRLGDRVFATDRKRAARAGRSLKPEEELRLLLTEAALRPQREFAREAAALGEELRGGRHGPFSGSADLIREEREARG